MRYLIFGVVVLIACDAPTDMNSKEAPISVDGMRVVHPSLVTVTVTPGSASAYPQGTVQYFATARDGEGRILTPASWKWTSSDTTVAVVSVTGLAMARAVGHGIISATAYPPLRR